jgi:hypothetical protein
MWHFGDASVEVEFGCDADGFSFIRDVMIYLGIGTE